MEDLVNLVTLADGSKIILQDEDGISLSLISNSRFKVSRLSRFNSPNV